MGERKKDALRVNFDRKLKLEFHGVKVTSDAERLCRASKAVLQSKFFTKLPPKRKSLTVQGDFDKVVDIERIDLCFLSL